MTERDAEDIANAIILQAATDVRYFEKIMNKRELNPSEKKCYEEALSFFESDYIKELTKVPGEKLLKIIRTTDVHYKQFLQKGREKKNE